MKKASIVVFCLIIALGFLLAPQLLKPSESSSDNSTNETTNETAHASPQPSNNANPTPSITVSPTSQATQTPTANTSPQPTQSNSTPILQLTETNLQNAIGNATSFMQATNESYALLLMNVAYRRFGIDPFSNSLASYDQLLMSNPQNAAVLRVFRRIADNNNQLQAGDLNSISAETDKITVPALYSDRYSLSSEYPQLLNDAANGGGYLLTHALLASIWFKENGHELSADFTLSLCTKSAALIRVDQTVTDLEVEAAALLYLSGQGSMVDPAFVQYVLDSQRADGGWSDNNATSDPSNWHTTVLALLLLLHVEYPAGSYSSMIDTT